MKFTVAGSKVVCSRIDQTIQGDDRYRNVVDFDAHVATVPPHVAAKLTTREVGELKQFLEDRKRIEADPAEINMLEALPDLIEEVTDVLHSANRLSDSLDEKLTASVANLADVLREVRPQRKDEAAPIESMRAREVLKQRLENIKQDL